MYKVFLRDKVICFTTPEIAPSGSENVFLNPELSELQRILSSIDKSTTQIEFWFVADDAEKLFINFYTRMKIVAAAGGIIINELNQMLFIYRRGHWDLPKGKIDFGETEEQAAVREVSEETGLNSIKIHKRLISSFHVYTIGHEWILKETHWFLMKTKSTGILVPQAEEGISQIRWIDEINIDEMTKKVYLSLQAVVSDAAAICFK